MLIPAIIIGSGCFTVVFGYLWYTQKQCGKKRLKALQQKINLLESEKLTLSHTYSNLSLHHTLRRLIEKNELLAFAQTKTPENLEDADFIEQMVITDREALVQNFENVHCGFLSRLLEKHPDLSPNDCDLCLCLRLNLSTKEIGAVLNKNLPAVEKARNRLRKKLNVAGEVNLTAWLSLI